MEAVAQRLEARLPVAVRVDLWSLDVRQRAQECITENISTHGARVVSSKPLKRNERLNLHSAQDASAPVRAWPIASRWE